MKLGLSCAPGSSATRNVIVSADIHISIGKGHGSIFIVVSSAPKTGSGRQTRRRDIAKYFKPGGGRVIDMSVSVPKHYARDLNRAPHHHLGQPRGIDPIHRVIPHIRIQVQIVLRPRRIRLQKPPDPRRVKPRLVIVQLQMYRNSAAEDGIWQPTVDVDLRPQLRITVEDDKFILPELKATKGRSAAALRLCGISLSDRSGFIRILLRFNRDRAIVCITHR